MQLKIVIAIATTLGLFATILALCIDKEGACTLINVVGFAIHLS